MKRHLLNLLTAVSLLLCVAVCVLWFRSHRAGDDIGYSSSARRSYLRTGGGELGLDVSRYDTERFPPRWRWDTDPRRTNQLYMIRRDTLSRIRLPTPDNLVPRCPDPPLPRFSRCS